MLYIAVIWGSETERFCDIMGVFTRAEDAVEHILEYVKSIVNDGDGYEIPDIVTHLLAKGFVWDYLDYAKVVKQVKDGPINSCEKGMFKFDSSKNKWLVKFYHPEEELKNIDLLVNKECEVQDNGWRTLKSNIQD